MMVISLGLSERILCLFVGECWTNSRVGRVARINFASLAISVDRRARIAGEVRIARRESRGISRTSY